MSAPRENLVRSAPFVAERAEGDTAPGDGRDLTGYAAVFDQPTLIDSWEGTFFEKIRKGAFRKSLRERTPVLQFDHGRHPLIGSIPLGRIDDLREDDHGLAVSARLSGNWLIEPIRDAIADEAVDGMSFRFSVVRDEWRDNNGRKVRDDELFDLLWMPGDRGPLERTLVEVKLHEVGPVVFPQYMETSVGVRAREVADLVRSDTDLAREVRAALARSASDPGIDDLGDPDTRREVARVLLFGSPPDAPPPDGHPSTNEPRQSPGLSHVRTAPPEQGHPDVDDSDAPPSDGHPSPTPTPTGLRTQISEIRALMRDRLASIEGEQ
ncbi:HK97 family phage prohead protease [Nocardiopsis gilva]|uniref:HK97 family phage prohead protease n=1 Tax=Nocardiopsis gilva TaxID=280236 RepID=UPI00034DCC4E|nr:HK97 family phage prohead protease [Nocardiopsis gilva]